MARLNGALIVATGLLTALGVPGVLPLGTPGERKIDGRFWGQILQGYAYVGPATCTDGRIGFHGNEEVTLPKRLQPGTCYVFRRPRSAQGEGWESIVERLKSKGVLLTSVPTSPTDLVYLTIGGPLFTIHFDFENMRGVLFNAVDQRILNRPELRSKWYLEEVALQFLD
jgi:hypothetical protein